MVVALSGDNSGVQGLPGKINGIRGETNIVRSKIFASVDLIYSIKNKNQ